MPMSELERILGLVAGHFERKSKAAAACRDVNKRADVEWYAEVADTCRKEAARVGRCLK